MSLPKPDDRPRYLQVFDRYFPVGSAYWRGDNVFQCWDEKGYWPERFDQPRELQLFWAAAYCESDIENGGFYQFFTNPTGVLAPEAVEGLRMIDLGDGADVVAEAMEYFGPFYPRSRDFRIQSIPSLNGGREANDPFIDMDEKFDACVTRDYFNDRFTAAANRFAERYL